MVIRDTQDNVEHSILVVNPNSTASMTKSIEELVSKSPTLTKYHCSFTNPDTGPESINNDDDAAESLQPCISLLESDDQLLKHNGFLVACYSNHPLVPWLQDHFEKEKSERSRLALGIFEASVIRAMELIDSNQLFGIVSTGKVWEALLTEGVNRLHKSHGMARRPHEAFAGVETTGLNAVELHEKPFEEVRKRMKDATKRLVKKADVGAICLGCAGMAGMDDIVREALVEELGDTGEKVVIVDGVLAGVEILGNELQETSS